MTNANESQSASNNSERIDYLDSVRGIAALMVLFGHWIGGYSENESIGFTHKTEHLLYFIFNLDGAVSVFFVLSGLVLSYRYFKGDTANKPLQLNFAQYIVARIFRLYPAYLFMIAIYFLLGHRGELNITFLTEWIAHKDLGFLREATLLNMENPMFGAGWTLGMEVAVSLILPIFIFIMYYKKEWFWYILILFTVVLNRFYCTFAFNFLLGLWIAANFDYIKNYNIKIAKWYPYRFLLVLLTVGLWSTAAISRYNPYNDWHFFNYLFSLHHINNYYLTGIAATLFLMFVINNRLAQRLLSARILLFFGKISYGVYITHWLFLFGVFKSQVSNMSRIFGTHTPHQGWYLVGLFVLISSILAGTAIYYCIELPFIRIGKRVARRFEHWA